MASSNFLCKEEARKLGAVTIATNNIPNLLLLSLSPSTVIICTKTQSLGSLKLKTIMMSLSKYIRAYILKLCNTTAKVKMSCRVRL